MTNLYESAIMRFIDRKTVCCTPKSRGSPGVCLKGDYDMRKMTSAYANKMLKSLEEDKAFWVNKEAFIRSATFSHGKLGIVRAPFGG